MAMALGLAAPLAALAGCSQPIQVPVAPTGFNVLLRPELDDRVEGVYPDLLRQLGQALGCEFTFPVVPRARVALMFFEAKEADIFVPASRTAERDLKALFVPMLRLTPSLITLASRPLAVNDVAGLLQAKTALRGAMVRSYTWGDEYEALMRQLVAEKRIDFVADLRTVSQMLRSGRVDFTILPPTLLYSALQEPGAVAAAAKEGALAFTREFRFTALRGLPRSEVGAYLSRQTLTANDLQLLREGLGRAARDGSLMRSLQRYYPAEVLRQDVQIIAN
ncbi:polar amino acid transport system substrate-binding protein [Paucibacter oligotrophus]|uniref:Polar amino acid transport system substrate-binding protein n=1 Tax=Roseateles oligotrophus TaxID=1769250 RepID=A0A840LBX6_9BURK|nr:transporter substrate-binding domain-containing protein [Roseateles oligotrophus]MBB4842817.1 polar amino acid transport system substrate-binding protein [Roseateles oligotrophus]